MADNQDDLPPGFTRWPPANPHDFVDEIAKAWGSDPGRHGKHWGLQVFGHNPISGYLITIQPTEAGGP
jgi:hypothetical protein